MYVCIHKHTHTHCKSYSSNNSDNTHIHTHIHTYIHAYTHYVHTYKCVHTVDSIRTTRMYRGRRGSKSLNGCMITLGTLSAKRTKRMLMLLWNAFIEHVQRENTRGVASCLHVCIMCVCLCVFVFVCIYIVYMCVCAYIYILFWYTRVYENGYVY
jgi:hypothetical protein